MAVIVAATAAAGFLASVVLVHFGFHRMWLRYGLSVGIAYAAFVSFVWLWIQKKRRMRFDDPGWDGGSSAGGGRDVGGPDPFAVIPSSDGDGDADAGVGGGASHPGGFLDLDDAVVWFAVIAAIVSAVVAGAYVVFIAPNLLAEVLLDGVLATTLYRRLRAVDSRHWLETAVARTWVPVVVVAAFFVIAGAVCHWYAPEASTLSGVWRHYCAKP
jgi:hypothetical protein